MAKLKRIDQRVDLGLGIIKAKTCATRGADPEVIHQGADAMLPCPDGDAFFVEHRGNVVRMSGPVIVNEKIAALSWVVP